MPELLTLPETLEKVRLSKHSLYRYMRRTPRPLPPPPEARRRAGAERWRHGPMAIRRGRSVDSQPAPRRWDRRKVATLPPILTDEQHEEERCAHQRAQKTGRKVKFGPRQVIGEFLMRPD